jgi:hypothetical protein
MLVQREVKGLPARPSHDADAITLNVETDVGVACRIPW